MNVWGLIVDTQFAEYQWLSSPCQRAFIRPSFRFFLTFCIISSTQPFLVPAYGFPLKSKVITKNFSSHNFKLAIVDSEKHDSHFTFSEGFTIKHLDFYLTSATIMYASKAYSFNRSVPPVFLHQFQKDRLQSLANQNTFSNHEDNHTRATYLVLQNKEKSRRE